MTTPPSPLRPASLAAWTLCLLGLAAQAGCGLRIGGDSTVSAENDRLRAENFDLKTKIEGLDLDRTELRRKVDASHNPLAADILEATPALTTLTIATTSHVRAATSDKPTRAIINLDARDGRNRAIQITGTLTLSITTANNEVISHTVAPLQLRDAFRGGSFGGGYTVEIPIPDGAAPATVRLQFTEGHGLGTFTGESPLQLLERPVRTPTP